jgi:hypothetical protein
MADDGGRFVVATRCANDRPFVTPGFRLYLDFAVVRSFAPARSDSTGLAITPTAWAPRIAKAAAS